jgi:hypothetical protein
VPPAVPTAAPERPPATMRAPTQRAWCGWAWTGVDRRPIRRVREETGSRESTRTRGRQATSRPDGAGPGARPNLPLPARSPSATPRRIR